MQDVALKLVDKIDTLRDVASFRPWLRRIILNVCRGAARQLRPTLSLDAPLHPARNGQETSGAGAAGIQPPARDEGHEAVLDRRDDAHHVFERALSLPPEYREPLLLRCVQSMSYQQISELLELPVTTIETRLARARRMLREELDTAAKKEDAMNAPPARAAPPRRPSTTHDSRPAAGVRFPGP